MLARYSNVALCIEDVDIENEDMNANGVSDATTCPGDHEATSYASKSNKSKVNDNDEYGLIVAFKSVGDNIVMARGLCSTPTTPPMIYY